MKKYSITYIMDVDQSVTIRKISKSLHESVENISVVLNRGLGFSEDVLGKSFPCVQR